MTRRQRWVAAGGFVAFALVGSAGCGGESEPPMSVPDGGRCTDSAACMAGEFCAIPQGQACGSAGTCQPTAVACEDIAVPTCGCDGRNYPSPCYAARAGVNVAHSGNCSGL